MTEHYEKQENELYERVKQCKNMQTEIDRLYIDKEELEQAYLHEKIAKGEVEELLECSISRETIKHKIVLHTNYLSDQAITSNPTLDSHFRDKENYVIQVLRELLEGEK